MKISQIPFELQSGQEYITQKIAIFYEQRAIAKIFGIQECLRFVSWCLIYISVKLNENV